VLVFEISLLCFRIFGFLLFECFMVEKLTSKVEAGRQREAGVFPVFFEDFDF